MRVAGDPQSLLRALVERTPVLQFEITKPSLHDIFVRIARPGDADTTSPHAYVHAGTE